MKKIKKKFILGAAQFGNQYGEFNKNKILESNEIKKILEYLIKSNCNIIDTASDYNRSEKIIGDLGLNNLKIITKIGIPNEQILNKNDFVNKIIFQSKEKLKVSKIYCLLFRNPIKLVQKKFLPMWKSAEILKKENIIDKIGITIYTPRELDVVLDKIKPDVVQLPFNIFDHRIKNSGWLNKLYDNDIEIHARSIFLQGLLLQKTNYLKRKFYKFDPLWKKYIQWVKKENLDPISLCLSYALSERKISKIVVGVENKKQLIKLFNAKEITKKIPDWMKNIKEELINPALWK